MSEGLLAKNLSMWWGSGHDTRSRGPARVPAAIPRAFDVHTGKLVWQFHAVPRPGEPGNETWGPDGWKDRAGPSAWGAMTIDVERGLVFMPQGNPADNFYGADRKGMNLFPTVSLPSTQRRGICVGIFKSSTTMCSTSMWRRRP